MTQIVVLSGGVGTRLWPFSTAALPKQFRAFEGGHTLLQKSLLRFQSWNSKDCISLPPIIVGSVPHFQHIKNQIDEIGFEDATIILEPASKNTAPALTLAAQYALAQETDPVLVVVPSDQSIENPKSFIGAISKAVNAASLGSIVTLGVAASRAETGYGYIQIGSNTGQDGVFEVVNFHEKPVLALAEQFSEDPSYYWNSGIFVLRASVWMDAIRVCCPELTRVADQIWRNHKKVGNAIEFDSREYTNIAPDSIDYAVIENFKSLDFPVKMIPLETKWSDLGAWDAVASESVKDEKGNTQIGMIGLFDCEGVYARSTKLRIIALGLKDIILVEASGFLLAIPKERSQEVKRIVEQLRPDDMADEIVGHSVIRPWGSYETVHAASGIKVKTIKVQPGAALSLQYHYHRAEYWVVIRGTANVILDRREFLLTEGESIVIPKKSIHRLKNPGDGDLEIVEIQFGHACDESDIVRIDDLYGRV